jgi:hypothetical protein
MASFVCGFSSADQDNIGTCSSCAITCAIGYKIILLAHINRASTNIAQSDEISLKRGYC